ncbi:MAG: YceI family protein [Gemmatimonadetes bacterium]|nr:YceI family protein [Gemmatimonadota bacterium]
MRYSVRGTFRVLSAAMLATALASATEVGAQQSTFDFTVSGNSTVRSWTCTVRGAAQVTTGSGAAVRGFDSGVAGVALTVRVNDFQCPEDEMRQHLLEAMRATEYPTITFRLDNYQASAQGVTANGSLTIQAATNPVSLPLTVTPGSSGVQIAGELPLDMTAYGVQPPVVMLGLMRVRPQIRIQFTGTVGR